MNAMRTELCEIIQDVLPKCNATDKADASTVVADLAPVLAEAIADAILARFRVKHRPEWLRDLMAAAESGETVVFEYTPRGDGEPRLSTKGTWDDND